MRTKGRVVEEAEPAPVPKPKPEPEGRRKGKQVDGEKPLVPNWIAYQNIVFFVGKNVDAKGNRLGGKLPRCKVCKGLLDPQANHKCPGYVPDLTRLNTNYTPKERLEIRKASWEIAGDWDDDQYDRTTPGEIHPVVKYGEDWDDDHYDPTTPGEIDLEYIAECEPSEGGIIEGWDEDDWLAWRRQQLGYSKDSDPNLDAADEQLDWDHEEYEDYEDYEE